RKPQIGRIRKRTTTTCHNDDAVNAQPDSFPRTHSTRNAELPASSLSLGGRGPVKKSRTLVQNSRQGDSQSTPRSSLGRRECGGSSISSISCSCARPVNVGIFCAII